MITVLMFAFYSFLKLLDFWFYGYSYWNPSVLIFLTAFFIVEGVIEFFAIRSVILIKLDKEEAEVENDEEYVFSSRENEDRKYQLQILDEIRTSAIYDEKCPYTPGTLRAEVWKQFREAYHGFKN